jgi:hypothetical protein
VAVIMSSLALLGGWQVLRQARGELLGQPVSGPAH